MQTIYQSGHNRQPREHQCPWCMQWHERDGICRDCESRIQLASIAKSRNVVILPGSAIYQIKSFPTIWKILGLLEDQGALSGWIRPDHASIASDLGVTTHAVYRAMQRLFLLGVVERRTRPGQKRHTPSDYRIVLDSPLY